MQELTPEKRICFMYVLANGTYSWTVDKTACLRNIRSAPWFGVQWNIQFGGFFSPNPFNFRCVQKLRRYERKVTCEMYEGIREFFVLYEKVKSRDFLSDLFKFLFRTVLFAFRPKRKRISLFLYIRGSNCFTPNRTLVILATG